MEYRNEKGQLLAGHKGLKPKGAQHRTSAALRTRINTFLSDNWERIVEDFEQLEPKERLIFYERLMQYGLPKLQSIEYSAMMERQIENLSDEDLTHLLDAITDKIESNG
jgi:hypothetical protein